MSFFALVLLAQSTTPNEFLARGTPTFVAGTLGDERSDRIVRGQIELIRELLFPAAEVVDDIDLAVAGGEREWPALPVIYGGPHVNAALAKLDLPFELGARHLGLEGRDPLDDRKSWNEVYEDGDVRLIAVVPAAGPSERGMAHPEFLLYAGTGTPGVGEINAIPHGNASLLVADTFGVRVEGRLWADEDGSIHVALGEHRPRPDWHVESFGMSAWSEGHTGRRGKHLGLRVFRLASLGDAPSEQADGMLETLLAVQEKLGLVRVPAELTLYLYPDRETKRAITGNPGDGHADPEAGRLHVVLGDADSLRRVVAHEGTHALAFAGWGMAGSPALGEGLAVWASGGYGGTALEDWRAHFRGAKPPAVLLLLGPEFRRAPEPKVYPLAGLLVGALVDEVGLDGLRDHLYGATAATWSAACERAGSSAEALEHRFAALFH